MDDCKLGKVINTTQGKPNRLTKVDLNIFDVSLSVSRSVQSVRLTKVDLKDLNIISKTNHHHKNMQINHIQQNFGLVLIDDNKDVSRIQLHSSLAIGGNKVRIEDLGLSLLIVKVIFFCLDRRMFGSNYSICGPQKRQDSSHKHEFLVYIGIIVTQIPRNQSCNE